MLVGTIVTRALGYRELLIHGEPLVYDRWRWLSARLPKTRGDERLIDIGFGTGALSIAAAKRGYRVTGISWDGPAQTKATRRAALCGVEATCTFENFDVTGLDRKSEMREAVDVVVCLECVEHIHDDAKLLRDIADMLVPGGRLLLTTPYLHSSAITASDDGPFGRYPGDHVRRGYTRAMLAELMDQAGLVIDEVSYCSGLMSQKLTWLHRRLGILPLNLGWFVTLPLRPLAILIDRPVTAMMRWPHSSICVEAYKRRWLENVSEGRQ